MLPYLSDHVKSLGHSHHIFLTPDYKRYKIDLFGELVLYICDIWKKILKSGPICANFCGIFIEVWVRGVRRWNFRWSTSYMRAKCPPSARSSMCTQQAQPPPPNWGTPKKWTWRKGGIFGQVGSGVPGGCIYCAALRGDERDLYRLSIDDSINIWSVILVWDFGACVWGTPKSAISCHTVPMGQNGPFSPNFKSKYLSELTSYRNDQGMKSPLKFSNFPKMLPKRAFRTHKAPKTTNVNTQIFEIWGFLGFVICVFGCVGCEKPFLATF